MDARGLPMSSPTNGNGSDDRLKYAPPWARRQPPRGKAEPRHAERSNEPERPVGPRDLDLPDDAPPLGIAEEATATSHALDQPSVWLRAPAKVFGGDVAMRELTRRMTLEPQAIPEPLPASSPRSSAQKVVGFLGLTGVAAAIAYAVVLFAFPDEKQPALGERDFQSSLVLAGRAPDRAADQTSNQAAPPRLALIERRRAAANESVPLGVTLTSASAEGVVVMSGLAAGARISVGAPLGVGSWEVPVADLAQAHIEPPHDFLGAMDLSVELRLVDDSVADRNTMRIEWGPGSAVSTNRASKQAAPVAGPENAPHSVAAPTQPGKVTLDREEIAALVKRGQDFIANGDLASARLVLRRAADSGDAQSALLLGSTYDPATFKHLRVIGSGPDPAQARAWYQRAAELGSAEAVRRLEPLARGAN